MSFEFKMDTKFEQTSVKMQFKSSSRFEGVFIQLGQGHALLTN